MKRFFISFLFLAFRLLLFCQTNTDSLFKLYSNLTLPDTVRLKAIHDMAWNYCYVNADSSKVLVEKEMELALQTHQKKWQANAYNLMGILLMNTASYPEAISHYKQALQLFEECKNKKGVANCYNNLGLIYLYQSDYPNSFTCFLKALKLREQINDKNGLGNCYGNIGIIYRRQKIYDKAIEYTILSLKIHESLGNKTQAATLYNNIGVIYQEQKKYTEALNYLHTGKKIREEIGDKKGVSDSYADIASTYVLQGKEYKTAQQYFEMALAIKKEIDDKEGIAACYLNMAEMFYKDHDYKEAIKYNELAKQKSHEIKYKEVERFAYEALSKAYFNVGDYKKAYKNELISKKLTDSIFNVENSKILSDLKIKYQSEKNREELEKQKIIANEEIQKRKITTRATTALLCLVFLVLLLFWNRLKLKQNNKQQKEIASAVINTQEEERKRIAEDLHDGLGYLLSTIKIKLHSQAHNNQVEIESSLNQAIDEIQKTTFNLMPHTLEEEGLLPALNELIFKTNNTGVVFVQLQTHNIDRLIIDKFTQINLYRIIQEAIGNSLKHSGAKNINIQIIHRSNHLVIMIEDDGVGFDTSSKKTGRGLKNIINRTAWLNGSSHIDSLSKHGTTITIEIPLKNEH